MNDHGAAHRSNPRAGVGTHSRLAAAVRRAALALAAGALALLLAEGLVRVVVPAERWRFRDATKDWRLDPEVGWTQRANLDVTSRADQGWTVRYRTSSDGLRPHTARRERRPGRLRVMFFGDSTVVGRAVPAAATVDAQLERLLHARGSRVEVLNAGVEGHSPDQTLLLMRRLLPLYRPDLVVFGFCDNDLAGISESTAFGMGKPRFRLGDDGELVLEPPRLPAAVPELGSGPRRWVQLSALYRLARPAVVMARARWGRWEERNLLGMTTDIYYDPASLEHVDWPLLTRLLVEMKRTVQAHGGELVLYSHPALGEVWEPFIRESVRQLGIEPARWDRYALQRALSARAGAAGIAYCPLVDRFRAEAHRGPFHLLPRDPHCNAEGYRLTAEALASFLEPRLAERRLSSQSR